MVFGNPIHLYGLQYLQIMEKHMFICLFVLKKDFGGNAASHRCKQGQKAKISLSYFAQNSQQLKMFLQ